MITRIISILIFINIYFISFSQETHNLKLYNPKADGMKQLDSALIIAKAENKHVLIQVGGNWCSWCHIFNNFIKNDAELDSLLNANYVEIHVNYDGKKESFPILERLDYPHRFGFPVIVIVDASGKRLHTQNTWYLEDGESYSRKKVLAFLKAWTTIAVNPKTYSK